MGKITAVSPLAPDHFPDLPVIDGVRFATIAAGGNVGSAWGECGGVRTPSGAS